MGEDNYKERMLNAMDSHRQEERDDAKMYSRYLHHRRERFDQAEYILGLQFSQNLDDLIFVQEKVNEWASKSKGENKKMFNDVCASLIRISAYILVIEGTAKSLVCDAIRESNITDQHKIEIDKLKSDIKVFELKKNVSDLKYEEEIKTLKQQISFHEQK